MKNYIKDSARRLLALCLAAVLVMGTMQPAFATEIPDETVRTEVTVEPAAEAVQAEEQVEETVAEETTEAVSEEAVTEEVSEEASEEATEEAARQITLTAESEGVQVTALVDKAAEGKTLKVDPISDPAVSADEAEEILFAARIALEPETAVKEAVLTVSGLTVPEGFVPKVVRLGEENADAACAVLESGEITLTVDLPATLLFTAAEELLISDAGVEAALAGSPVASITEISYSVKTGTVPFDNDDAPGNDSNSTNNIIRTYDYLEYHVSVVPAVKEGMEGATSANIYFQAKLPVSFREAQFRADKMTWFSEEVGCKISEKDGVQTMDCVLHLANADGSPVFQSAEGTQVIAVPFVIQVLNMGNGQTLAPSFTSWVEFDTEKKSIDCDKVTVSASPSFNVALRPVSKSNVGLYDTFNFNTGNEKANNKGIGDVTGFLCALGITLQNMGSDNGKGMKGVEIPKGEFSFDVTLSNTYKDAKGVVYDLNSEEYGSKVPLVWSCETNGDNGDRIQEDGRKIPEAVSSTSAYGVTPGTRNISSEKRFQYSNYTDLIKYCWNSGNWTVKQDGAKLSFTVSDYVINPYAYPHCDIGKNEGKYWTLGKLDTMTQGCFSGGELFIVVPTTVRINDNEQTLTDAFGAGSQYLRADVVFEESVLESGETVNLYKMKATPVSEDTPRDFGTTLNDAKSAEIKVEPLSPSVSTKIKYGYSGNDQTTLPGYYSDTLSKTSGDCCEYPNDVQNIGGRVSIDWMFSYNPAGTHDGVVVAADMLVKFDGDAMEPDYDFNASAVFANPDTSAFENASTNLAPVFCKDQSNTGHYTFYYAAKSDGKNWTDDAEMLSARPEKLEYYTDRASMGGKSCVGILMVYRDLESTNRIMSQQSMSAFMKLTDDLPFAGAGYQVVTTARYETYSELRKACGSDDESEIREYWNEYYTDGDDFISAANMPAEGYTKLLKGSRHVSSYTKPAYKNGVIDLSEVSQNNRSLGDVVFLMPYMTNVNKKVADLKSDGSGPKAIYSLDSGENVVKYEIAPAIVKNVSLGDATTTITILDTLPENIEFNAASIGEIQLKKDDTTEISIGDSTATVKCEQKGQTVTFTFTGVKLEEAAKGMPTITITALITPNVKDAETYTNQVTICSNEDHRAIGLKGFGNYSECDIKISKLAAIALSETVNKKINEKSDPITFNLSYSNDAATGGSDVIFMDILPHNNNVGLASNYTGSYKVTNLEFTPCVNTSASDYTFWYTTDETAYGINAGKVEVNNDEVYHTTDGENKIQWTKGEINGNTVTLGSDFTDKKVTAFIFVGPFPSKGKFNAAVTIAAENNSAGDEYWNSISVKSGGIQIGASAKATIINRIVDGLVWMDDNQNGVRDTSEVTVSGVKVTLVNDNNPVTLTTVTDVNGEYEFKDLPAGTYRVEFNKDDGFGNLKVTAKNVGDDSSIDCDCTGDYDSNGLLKKAVSKDLSLPEIDDSTESEIRADDVDLGLFQPINLTYVVSGAVPSDYQTPEIVKNVTYNGSVTLATATTTAKTNADGVPGTWKFAGWYLNVDCSGDAVKELKNITADTTVYGKWTFTATTYKLTYSVTGDMPADYTAPAAETGIAYNATKTLAAVSTAESTKNGVPGSWSFDGWYLDAEMTKKAENNKVVVTVDTTVYGKWTFTATTYKLNYSVTGDMPADYTVPAAKTGIAYNATETLAAATTTAKTDANGVPGTWTFSGWFDNAECTGTAITEAKNIKADTTVYGKWTFVPSYKTVTYHAAADAVYGAPTYTLPAQDAEALNGQPYELAALLTSTETEATVNENKVPGTWSFDGWYTNEGCTGEPITAIEKLTTDTDVYGKWSFTPDPIEIKVIATWLDGNSTERPEASVTLKADGNAVETEVLAEAEEWKHTFENVVAYTDAGAAKEFTLEAAGVDGYSVAVSGSAAEGFIVTYTLLKDVTVKVEWTLNGADQPNGVILKLNGDAQIQLPQEGKWEYTWKDLPAFDQNGKAIAYSAAETAMILKEGEEAQNLTDGELAVYAAVEGETASKPLAGKWTVATPKAATITFINTWNPAEDVEIKETVIHVFKADPSGELITDSAEFKLEMKNDQGKFAEVESTKTTEGTVDFKISAAGNYRITEISAPRDYQKAAGVWNFTVTEGAKTLETDAAANTNTYTTALNIAQDAQVAQFNWKADENKLTVTNYPSKITISGEKTWDDNEDQDGLRPDSITVTLYANGKADGKLTVTANAEGKWLYSFGQKDAFDANGKAIAYSVKEDTVKYYTTEYNGYNIKNTYIPELRTIKVTKVWNDSNDKDKLRPESIKVVLMANGVEVADSTVVLDSSNSWSCKYEGQRKYSNGKAIEYTVKEVVVPDGYKSAVKGTAADGFTITNTHPVYDNDNPKTDDQTNSLFWTLLMAVSAVGASCSGLWLFRKKED